MKKENRVLQFLEALAAKPQIKEASQLFGINDEERTQWLMDLVATTAKSLPGRYNAVKDDLIKNRGDHVRELKQMLAESDEVEVEAEETPVEPELITFPEDFSAACVACCSMVAFGKSCVKVAGRFADIVPSRQWTEEESRAFLNVLRQMTVWMPLPSCLRPNVTVAPGARSLWGKLARSLLCHSAPAVVAEAHAFCKAHLDREAAVALLRDLLAETDATHASVVAQLAFADQWKHVSHPDCEQAAPEQRAELIAITLLIRAAATDRSLLPSWLVGNIVNRLQKLPAKEIYLQLLDLEKKQPGKLDCYVVADGILELLLRHGKSVAAAELRQWAFEAIPESIGEHAEEAGSDELFFLDSGLTGFESVAVGLGAESEEEVEVDKEALLEAIPDMKRPLDSSESTKPAKKKK